MGWFGLHFRAQREKPSILIGLKLKNSKIRKNDPPGAHGPPGLGRGWPHNPPLGPMGPHGSFMVAPLFNDEAAKSRYGAQWAPQGSPKSRAMPGQAPKIRRPAACEHSKFVFLSKYLATRSEAVSKKRAWAGVREGAPGGSGGVTPRV